MWTSDKKPGIGQICQALRTSKVRKALYEYLCSIYPRKALIPEISVKTGHSSTNLKGAFRGDEKSFDPEASLLHLCLGESEKIGQCKRTVEMFGATEWGVAILDQLKYYERNVKKTDRHSLSLTLSGLAVTAKKPTEAKVLNDKARNDTV